MAGLYPPTLRAKPCHSPFRDGARGGRDVPRIGRVPGVWVTTLLILFAWCGGVLLVCGGGDSAVGRWRRGALSLGGTESGGRVWAGAWCGRAVAGKALSR